MKIEIRDITMHLPSQIDLFIASIGFESRSASVISHISSERIRNALLFQYPLHNQIALKSFHDILPNIVTDLKISASKAIETADMIYQQINTALEQPLREIVVDITTFHREALLLLLRSLSDKKEQIKSLHLVYTPASQLNPNWLSKGVNEVRTVLGYAGEISPSNPLHMVVVLGFELERARSLLESYEPDLISVGVGTNSINSEFQKRNDAFINQLISNYGSEVQKFDVNLSNPFAACEDISKYLNKFGDYNTVIAPMNNKISTVGVGLFALRNPKIQICYAEAALYNYTNFSESSHDCYIFQIDGW